MFLIFLRNQALVTSSQTNSLHFIFLTVRLKNKTQICKYKIGTQNEKQKIVKKDSGKKDKWYS